MCVACLARGGGIKVVAEPAPSTMGNALPKILGTGVIGIIVGFIVVRAAGRKKVIADKPIPMDIAPSATESDELITNEKLATFRPRRVVILFGPPGAGKGTHGPKIENKLGIPAISTGDMLRAAIAAGTEVGKQAEQLLKAGKLVSDSVVVGIIKDRITHDDCKTGFILDGFPRTLDQAKAVDALLAETGERVTDVCSLEVPDSVLQERICGRWIHKTSGRSYHVKFAPPKSLQPGDEPTKENMKDDETGEGLIQRPDDTANALVQRLAEYHKQTMPVLEHYKPTGVVVTANANQAMDAVWAELEAGLSRASA